MNDLEEGKLKRMLGTFVGGVLTDRTIKMLMDNMFTAIEAHGYTIVLTRDLVEQAGLTTARKLGVRC